MPQQGPLLTWNLFVTLVLVPLCVSLLYFGIRRLITKKDKEREEKDKERELKDKKIEQLLAEREQIKEKALKEWQSQFAEVQCSIKRKVEEIAEEIHNRVTWEHCNTRRDTVDKILRELQNKHQ